jgi:hypothetical protein
MMRINMIRKSPQVLANHTEFGSKTATGHNRKKTRSNEAHRGFAIAYKARLRKIARPLIAQ